MRPLYDVVAILSSRAVPFWGGCSAGGFARVTFHAKKKLTTAEWATCVKRGQLTKAIQKLKPTRRHGPWHVLCDNESFLDSKASRSALRACGVKLWHIPVRSPGLNPVERVWSSLRSKLRKMDLADAVAKKPVLGKRAYVERVKRVLQSKYMQKVSANCALGLKRVCKELLARNP